MADSEVMQLSRAEKPWKPRRHRSRDEEEGMDPVERQTQTILRHVRSVLNKLTPQMFQPLMRKMCKISICSERHLVAVVDLLFEKAISEPQFSVAYANMSRCLMGLKVPLENNPGVTVNFRKILLNRCQREMESILHVEDLEKNGEQQHHLKDSEKEVRQRMVGNAKFIGELFKLKMLTEPIIHDCIVNLLKTASEESLECACVLLSTAGKDLDFEKAKPRMDQYFNHIEKMICERKTSNKMRFMLQDVIDLRQANWISRHGDFGPKTIDQIHEEAMKENMENSSQFKKSFPAFSHGSKSGDMDLFWRVHCIVNKITPQTFSPLMKQLSEMPINSEARLKGVIDLVFERALFVPKLSTTYANVCRCLAGLKVPLEDNWRVTVNFRKLLLNRCQKEFENGCHETGKGEQDDSGAQSEEEEQEETRAVGPRRSLGNIKFICDLFKMKLLTEDIIHDCIVKLFNSSQEESLCLLLLTVGKDLDSEKAKPRMDQYFNQMKNIIQEKSPMTQCLLQGLIDLRERCWIPDHSDPTADSIIDQICQDSVKKVKSASNNPQNILDVKPQSTDICTEELPKTEAYIEGLPKITVAYTEELPKNTETDTDELTKTTEAYTGDTITEELVRVGGLKQIIED